MRYAKIDSCEITNGKHVGLSLYVQGCDFHCNGCFNSSTWDFNGGREWTEETENYVLELCGKPYILRLSALGGEPMHPLNANDVIHLMKGFKELYPDKEIWMWTGYLFENIPNKEVLEYADYIIDGQFKKNQKDLTLEFRGSKNQRMWKKVNGEWQIVDQKEKNI